MRPEVVNLNNVIMDITKMIRWIIGEDIELRTDHRPWDTKGRNKLPSETHYGSGPCIGS